MTTILVDVVFRQLRNLVLKAAQVQRTNIVEHMAHFLYMRQILRLLSICLIQVNYKKFLNICKMINVTVFLSNLSHQRDSTVTYRTVPKRCFSKIPGHLKVTFFSHRDMHFYIKKYAATLIVPLNCSGKYTVTPYVTVIIVTACLKNIGLRISLHF